MTWTKIGDGFIGDHKLLALPRGVRLFHVEALVWSNAQGTDGDIPRHMPARFSDEPDPAAAAAALVDAGRWETTDTGWQIVGFDKEQLPASEVARRREETALRTKRWDHHRNGRHELCRPSWCKQAAASPDVTPDANPDASDDALPVRPAPTRSETGRKGRTSSASAQRRGASGRRSAAPSAPSGAWPGIDSAVSATEWRDLLAVGRRLAEGWGGRLHPDRERLARLVLNQKVAIGREDRKLLELVRDHFTERSAPKRQDVGDRFIASIDGGLS